MFSPETTPPKKGKVAAPAENERGLRRLLKSYMRLLHGYGDPAETAARDVVNGSWGEKDETALQSAMHYAGIADVPSTKPSEALLAKIMQAHDHVFSPKPDLSLQNRSISNSYQHMLHKISADAEASICKLPPRMQAHVHQLHPLMRAPAAEALLELNQKQVSFFINESYRDPSLQNDHVRKGNSYAPNGYSLHSHGLALDMAPKDARGNPVWNTKHPAWKEIMQVMQKHGFYSLGASQNWDYPHFEMPLKTREVIQYQQTADQWRMIPLERIPAKMRAHYAEHIKEFERAEKLITSVDVLSTPMAADNTRVAPPIKRVAVRQQ